MVEEGTGVLCEALQPGVRWDVLVKRGAAMQESKNV